MRSLSFLVSCPFLFLAFNATANSSVCEKEMRAAAEASHRMMCIDTQYPLNEDGRGNCALGGLYTIQEILTRTTKMWSSDIDEIRKMDKARFNLLNERDPNDIRALTDGLNKPHMRRHDIARDLNSIKLLEYHLCQRRFVMGGNSSSNSSSLGNRTESSTQQSTNLQTQRQSQHQSQSNTQQSSSNSPEAQQLQAAAQQAQASAMNVQQRADADAQRRGRRVHDPAAEAHDCLRVDPTGLFGAMVNTCSYKVWFNMCAYKPRESNALNSGWLTGLNCENQKFGLDSVGPNSRSAMHTKGAEAIHYFACKDPAMPADASFEGGSIAARCRNLGGN